MSVTVSYTSNLTVVETLSENIAGMSDKSVTHSVFNTTATANGASSPPVTLCASFQHVQGTSIDLTALVGVNNLEIDGTGLRVQFAKFKNPSTNANAITIDVGDSNGYDGFGAAFSITLEPGAEVLLRQNDAGSNISSSICELDVTGTGSQALDCVIVVG